MKSPLWALQCALFQRVKARSSYRVSDGTEEDASYPYVKIGEQTVISWGDKSKPGTEVLQTFHFWSQYNGKKECLDMMDETLRALTEDGWIPDLGAEYRVVYQQLDGEDVVDDLDGVTRHGILRMKYKIEEL